MNQAGGYCEELQTEMKQTDPSSHASRLIAQEIDRLTKGEDNVDKKDTKPGVPFIEIHSERPQKIGLKVRIPVKEHPRYNFVGKLLGPKGQTLKALQEQTSCKMAIMGRGSMREKDKEEQLRKEGGKYAHLNEDLHVLVECMAEPTEAYHIIGTALFELRKFLIPEIADELCGEQLGLGGDMGLNGGGGAPRGRGSFRGGPPERGGRGSFRGGPPERGGRGAFRGSGSYRGSGPPPSAPHGAPSGRGGAPPPGRGGAPPPGRGAPRGAPSSRGAPPSRGARAAPPAAQGYDYGSQGYGGGGYDQGYDDGYSSRSAPQDSSYDYYGSSNQGGYDSYSGGGGGGYGDYDGAEVGYGDYGDGYSAKAAPSQRGAARPSVRSHPYARQSQGGY